MKNIYRLSQNGRNNTRHRCQQQHLRLCTLKPSFKSKSVEAGKPLRAQEHTKKPEVKLAPSRKYFTQTDVTMSK